MIDKSFVFTRSPEDLAARLDVLKKDRVLHGKTHVVLVVDDARIVLCPFEFKAPGWLQWSALRAHMAAEAVDILSLDDQGKVAVDFQIFDRVQDRLCGAFLCCPRDLLDAYIAVVHKAGFVIEGFTVPSLVNIDRAFADLKSDTKRAACINLTPGRIDLAIFLGGKCELLRVVPFDHHDEAVAEVVRSLKSVCAKSQHKDCHGIFVTGGAEGSAAFVDAVARALDVGASMVDETAECGAAPYFRLNLARQHVFTRKLRRKIYWIMDIVIAVLAAVALHGAYTHFVQQQEIGRMKQSIDPAKAEEARQLEKKLGVKK